MHQTKERLFQKEYELFGFMLNHRQLIPIIGKELSKVELVMPDSTLILKSLMRRHLDDAEINIFDVASDSRVNGSSILDIYDCVYSGEEKLWRAYLTTYLDLYSSWKLSQFNPQEFLSSGSDPAEIIEKMKSLCFVSPDDSSDQNSQDAAYSSIDIMNEMKSSRIDIGFSVLNGLLNLCKKQLVVISARPKVGKTTFGINLINQIAKSGKKTIIFTFEMSAFEIVQKLVRLNYPKNFEEDYYEKVRLFLSEPHGDKIILIESSGMTPAEIRQKIVDHQPEVILVDQLDCLPVSARKDRHDLLVGENVVQLKKIAMEMNILVFLLHQLNRGADQRESPELYNLKDTGIAEQKADAVLMLWAKGGDFFVKIGANRMGDTGMIKYEFLKQRSLFFERELLCEGYLN